MIRKVELTNLAAAKAKSVMVLSEPATAISVFVNAGGDAGQVGSTLNVYAVVEGVRALVGSANLASASGENTINVKTAAAVSYEVEYVPAATAAATRVQVAARSYGTEPASDATASGGGGLAWGGVITTSPGPTGIAKNTSVGFDTTIPNGPIAMQTLSATMALGDEVRVGEVGVNLATGVWGTATGTREATLTDAAGLKYAMPDGTIAPTIKWSAVPGLGVVNPGTVLTLELTETGAGAKFLRVVA